MKDFFVNLFSLNSRDAALKRTNQIFLIGAWYLIFGGYTLGHSDNQVVRYLIFFTMSILFFLFVFSFVLTYIKFKGSLYELWIGGNDRRYSIECFLLVAIGIYQYRFCPEAYQIIIAYASLTILVIDCISFNIDNSSNNKKMIQ